MFMDKTQRKYLGYITWIWGGRREGLVKGRGGGVGVCVLCMPQLRKRYKKTGYLLDLIGVVRRVGVDVLRYRADLPLLHDLGWRGTKKVSMSVLSRQDG